jgi:hypothetical protein
MTIRHIALFRFAEGTEREQIAALATGLSGLPHAIDEIRAYRHGPDAGLNPTSWDYAVVGDFDSPEGYLAYRDHPVHQKLIAELVTPILADRASVQLKLD